MQHHAYLYEGSLADFDALAAEARKKLGFPDAADPDVVARRYERFGIDDARELAQMGALRSIGAKSLFIIGAPSITTEAQQALLKLFEEPREGLTFVLMAPHGTVIATLRSRMMEFPREAREKIKGDALRPVSKASPFIFSEAKKFLAASPKERSDMLAKILKQDDAREQARELLNAIESAVYAGKKKDMAALQEIAAMRPYLADRSASLKMLFEHLAAALPQQ